MCLLRILYASSLILLLTSCQSKDCGKIEDYPKYARIAKEISKEKKTIENLDESIFLRPNPDFCKSGKLFILDYQSNKQLSMIKNHLFDRNIPAQYFDFKNR